MQIKMEIKDKKKNGAVRPDICSIPSRSIFQESQARQTAAPGLSEKERCAQAVSIMAMLTQSQNTEKR